MDVRDHLAPTKLDRSKCHSEPIQRRFPLLYYRLPDFRQSGSLMHRRNFGKSSLQIAEP
jgi:hypothetical protein